MMLVFALGMLGPAGISAAGIFCDMGPESMLASAHACCEDHAMQDDEGHLPSHAGKTGDACDMDTYCLSTLDIAVNEAPAVQQSTSKVPAAVISGEIQFVPRPQPVLALMRNSGPTRIHSPPLFLLNASFLN